ncbi:hypothetical protein ACIBAC_00795 [Streptomyces sp. NPDC051362]|uniref:hypothetical protein n=1 Tax=Streptomyces sp. NPDC051362 TaxID=3365651 RepID=UPI0037B5CD72
MPPRTMLPPNLTRHYYETRRMLGQAEGVDTAPWFSLTADQRAAIERDVEVLRQAIRRAEEEQDLVAKYSEFTDVLQIASAAAPPAPGEEAATGPCDCPRCTMRAKFTQLLKEAYAPLGMTVSEPLEGPLGPFEVNVVPVDTRRFGVPLTAEEEQRLQRATDDAYGRLTLYTAGIDYAVLTNGPAEPIVFGPTGPKAQQDKLGEDLRALFRQWEADGRPLKFIPQPGKVTVGLDLYSPPIDETEVMLAFQYEKHTEYVRQALLRRHFPPKVSPEV